MISVYCIQVPLTEIRLQRAVVGNCLFVWFDNVFELFAELDGVDSDYARVLAHSYAERLHYSGRGVKVE